MAESWKEACWRAEQELAEYRDVIVPAMAEKLREWQRTADELEEANRNLARALRVAERERDAANRLMMRIEKELEFTRKFIHDQGLDFALASAWEKEKKKGVK